MRTQSSRPRASNPGSAAATVCRAAGLSSQATESSRSKQMMSAGTASALSMKRCWLPGTESMLRKMGAVMGRQHSGRAARAVSGWRRVDPRRS